MSATRMVYVRATLLLLLAAAPARAAPTINLYTMGPGEELFSTFGHAAICVERRCYNYGTADFRTPLPLTWSFIRGRALFWVGVQDERAMLGYYSSENRAVWRQTLPLAPDAADRLAAALEASTDERVKYYRYHHFNDNCTTRIRDLVDAATGGALRRAPTDRRLSFREWARAGFAGNAPLLVAVELLLGRSADRRTDSWDAMFLPSELRTEVAARLGARPELMWPSTRPPVDGAAWLGEAALVAIGLLLAALVLFGPPGLALTGAGITLGLVATILWALFALSTFPELTRNENLLAYWPTDLALAALSPRVRARYLDARIGVLALLVILHVGVLVQPLASLAPLVALLAARYRQRQ